MKNITLAMDEATLKAVRIYAAEHDTTINGLVRAYLSDIAARRSKAASGSEASLPGGMREERATSSYKGSLRSSIYKGHFTAADSDRARRARERLIELSESSTAEVGPITWSRDETHERQRGD